MRQATVARANLTEEENWKPLEEEKGALFMFYVLLQSIIIMKSHHDIENSLIVENSSFHLLYDNP